MYKRILVAVDGSHTAELALQEAIQLAKSLGAQLRIVHAVDEVNLNWDAEFGDSSEMRRALTLSGRNILDKASAAATNAGVGADVKLIVIDTLNRRIPQAIAEEAEAWPADLIIAGTHGRRGLSHVFLGSVAEGIVRVATKPVMLIRGK